MGFNMLFYIIFGTNLLTGGPVPVSVFCLLQSFAEKKYQTESKRNETFGSVIFGTNVIQRTSSASQEAAEAPTRQEGAPPLQGAPPVSWAPRAATDVLLPPIYTYVPRKHPGASRNTIYPAVTFCIREIPSWSLRRHSVEGGINHGGPVHQHPCPSDEL